jgi:hypothetical protein
VSQLAATSATIASVSGTNVTYSNGNLTSATVTTISGTTATYTSGTVTNLNSTSANITTLTGTTFGTTATTQLRGASAQITTLTSTSANITTITGTTLGAFTSGTITNLNSTSANITTLTGTTFGTTATTQIRANSLAVSATGAKWDANGDIYAVRSGGTSGVIFLGNSGVRYLFYDGGQYYLNGANLAINGALAVTANSGTYAISISGNAATVTNGFYTTGGTMTGQITTRETTGATPIVSGSGSNSLQVMVTLVTVRGFHSTVPVLTPSTWVLIHPTYCYAVDGVTARTTDGRLIHLATSPPVVTSLRTQMSGSKRIGGLSMKTSLKRLSKLKAGCTTGQMPN